MIKHLYGVEPHDAEWDSTLLLIHGIDGKYISTWTAADQEKAWPQIISSQLSGVSVLATDLDYSKWKSDSNSEKLLENYSRDLLALFEKDKILDRRVVIVSHSLGGLLVKKLLIDMSGFSVSRYFSDRVRLIRGVAFLGVPHNGSPYARKRMTWLARLYGGPTSITTRDLRPGSRVLEELKPKFRDDCPIFDRCHYLSVHETRSWGGSSDSTFFLKRLISNLVGPVVPASFSQIDVPEHEQIYADCDHDGVSSMQFSEAEKAMNWICGRLKPSVPNEEIHLRAHYLDEASKIAGQCASQE